jgi:hypothetical protein
VLTIYAICVIGTLAISGVYHWPHRDGFARLFMQRVDHCAIWCLPDRGHLHWHPRHIVIGKPPVAPAAPRHQGNRRGRGGHGSEGRSHSAQPKSGAAARYNSINLRKHRLSLGSRLRGLHGVVAISLSPGSRRSKIRRQESTSDGRVAGVDSGGDELKRSRFALGQTGSTPV